VCVAFDVNVVAPLALLQALDEQLVDEATVVSITSDARSRRTGVGQVRRQSRTRARQSCTRSRQPDRVLIVDPGDMRTEMHQDAFPGEDISDRPDPSASVPGMLALVNGDQPSGRYEARAVVTTEPRMP
jgi:hypothetical protein